MSSLYTFYAVILLAVAVLKRHFLPYLHTSFAILLHYTISLYFQLYCFWSVGFNIILQWQYYFIVAKRTKILSWIPEESWKKSWNPCESLAHLPLPKLSEVCKVIGLYLDFMGCLRQVKKSIPAATRGSSQWVIAVWNVPFIQILE